MPRLIKSKPFTSSLRKAKPLDLFNIHSFKLSFNPLSLRLITLGILSSLSACQVVQLRVNQLSTSLSNKTDNFLTHHHLSEATLSSLYIVGQNSDRCLNQPDDCISNIQENRTLENEDLYAAASEIYLAKALLIQEQYLSSLKPQQSISPNNQKYLKQQLYFLDKSLRYSYAYLFKLPQKAETRLFDQRQSQVRTFYNYSLSRLMVSQYLLHPAQKFPEQFNIGSSQYTLNFDQYPELKDMPIESLRSSYNLNFSGFYSINRQEGLGSEFVVVKAEPKQKPTYEFILNPEQYYAHRPNPNIHQAQYLPVSTVAQPLDFKLTGTQIIDGAPFKIQVLNPYQYHTTEVNLKPYTFTANYSVPYGLWLSENNLGSAGYWTLLNREQNLIMPHLFMLEPYQPNKKVIVMIHGLASSPEAWIALTNNIMGDKVLRDNYQVWQVFYSTNMPIFESRFQIHALLKQAFAMTKPDSQSSQNAVLIGHSMGGIISRLLVSDADVSAQAIPLLTPAQKQKLDEEPIIKERFIFRSLPQFSRAVFISSPHHGTAYADRWFTNFAKKIVVLPQNFFNAIEFNQSTTGKKHQFNKGLAFNGPSNLSPNSSFMKLTSDILPNERYIYHSIMGNQVQSQNPQKMSDGIVPYLSSHLTGQSSVKIIQGGHSIQETPEAVLELRRILRDNLNDYKNYLERNK